MKYQSQIQFYDWSLKVMVPAALLMNIPLAFIAYNRYMKGDMIIFYTSLFACVAMIAFGIYVFKVSKAKLRHYKEAQTQDLTKQVNIIPFELEPKMPDAEDMKAADELLAGIVETREVDFVKELSYLGIYIPNYGELVMQAALDADLEHLSHMEVIKDFPEAKIENYEHHVALCRLLLRHFGVEDLVPNKIIEQYAHADNRVVLITVLAEMSSGLRDYNLQVARGTTVAYLMSKGFNVHDVSDSILDRAYGIELNEGLAERIKSYSDTLLDCEIKRGELLDAIAIEYVLEEDRVKAELTKENFESSTEEKDLASIIEANSDNVQPEAVDQKELRGAETPVVTLDDAGLYEFPDHNVQKEYVSPDGRRYFWNDGWYEHPVVSEDTEKAEKRIQDMQEKMEKLVDPEHGNTQKILDLSVKIVNDHPETADLVAEIARANGINVESIPVNEQNRAMAERMLAGEDLPPVNRAERRALERETRRMNKKVNSKANLNRARKNSKKK